ncbi:MAG: amidohydrolase family protein [Saprospiraceae bacterium]
MTTYTADLLYPADKPPIQNGYITLDDSGMITDIGEVLPEGVEAHHHKGALVAGFINTHCHLELSHMKGRVDTGTGLLPFLRSVVTLRDIDPAEIAASIKSADQEMWDAGIQAVGDISNTADTAEVKTTSPIRYFTFVEAFDFLQGGAMAKEVFAKAKATYDAQPAPKRYVPHAPYTVSPELYAMISEANPEGGIVSIHNQETPAENELFESKTGGFIDFYKDFGFNIEHVSASAKTSLAATLPHLNPANRVLFVHNTLTTAADAKLAGDWSEKVYWATCPNANLYIENRLPKYADFIDGGARMTIGTDSLTSNWQLSILEEMKTIQRMQRYVDTRTLIQWATINGAEALGLDDQLGSLSLGKRPGLVLIEGFDNEGRFTPETTATRLR